MSQPRIGFGTAPPITRSRLAKLTILSVNESAYTELRVTIEEMSHIQAPIVRALGETGISGAQMQELFGQAISARCIDCGITLKNFQDVKEGDVLEAYETRQVERELS